MLRLRSREKQAQMFFLAVLESRAQNEAAGPPPRLADGVLTLSDRGAARRFRVVAERLGAVTPLLVELRP